MDEHRLQLQIRCAAAEENSEDLKLELQALKRREAEGKIDGLQEELEDLRSKFSKVQERCASVEEENEILRRANKRYGEKLKKVNSDFDRMKRAALMDEDVMVGLKKKLETAESDLESLKRKRTDSISPERAITGILKRPSAPSPSRQNVPSSSVQPTPKKSRNRKNRWDAIHSSSVPNKPPPISSNRDGLKRGYEHTPQIQRKDPVLHKSLSSARKKQDIIKDIEESAATLGLARSDFSLVFHRSTIEDQVTVTKKALAYVEIIITSTCVHLLKSIKAGGNPVQTYLDTLSLSQVAALRKDVDDALEQCEDSGRYMAVYQGDDDLPSRVRRQCFTKDGKPLKPHKLNDMLKNLHVRLGCHSQHFIPIGFYYAKWSEKLHFHLARAGRQDRSLSSTSRTCTPTPSPAPARSPSPPVKDTKSLNIPPLPAAEDVSIDDIDDMTMADAESSQDELRLLRAAIFDDTSNGKLTKKDKSVFWYREKRRTAWKAASAETMLNESEWNDRYDQGELEKVQASEEQLETLLAEHKQSIGYGPAGQGRN